MPENRRNGRHDDRERLLIFSESQMPPFNPEIEESLIGCVLIDHTGELLDNEHVAKVRPEHFFRDSHQIIWRAILDLWAEGVVPEAELIADKLDIQGNLDKIGGIGKLAEFASKVPHTLNAHVHAAYVVDYSLTRRVMESLQRSIETGRSREVVGEKYLDQTLGSLFEIATSLGVGSSSRSDGDIIDLAFQKIAARREGELTGLSTPFKRMDEMTMGLGKGTITVLAARPSAGKTAMAIRFCDHFTTIGTTPLFVSLEQGEEEIALRRLVMRSKVTLSKIQYPSSRSRDEENDLARAHEFIKAHPIEVADSSDLTPLTIAATARRLVRSKGIGAVVVDYLQIMRMDDGPNKTRQEQVAEAMGVMKRTAKSLNIPFIVLSQLSRRIEEREDKTPQLSDLRDSGAIEQDADIVAFIDRPEIYDRNNRPGEADLFIRKNRNGSTGPIPLTFFGPTMRFEARDDRPDPNHGGEPF